MKLTIDNFDNAGTRDYTASIDAEKHPCIQRQLNRPSRLTVGMIAPGPEFVVPVSGARISLERSDGQKLFTGYTTAVPEYEYMGWGERGPVYRYSVTAMSDEFLLDRKCIADRAPFVHRTAGEIVKTLASDIAPDLFDTAAIEGVESIPYYSANQQVKWSEHAARLAVRARAVCRVHDGKFHFNAVGKNTYTLDETAPEFCPD